MVRVIEVKLCCGNDRTHKGETDVFCRDGEFDVVDPTLEKVLGRKLMSMDQVLAPFLTSDGR